MNKSNKKSLLQLAYELSQQRLSAQAASAIGADARAMGYAGLSLTASALLLGLAKDSFVPLAMILGGMTFIASAAVSSYAARPVLFRVPGASFSDLSDDVKGNFPLESVLQQMGEFADEHIRQNNRFLKENSEKFILAQHLSIFGGVVAAVPQFLTAIAS